jgi:hypothetical protein
MAGVCAAPAESAVAGRASQTVALAPRPGGVASRAPTVGPFAHIFVVVMENADYASVLANPTLADLAHRFGLASRYYAVAHPSLPNYLALTSGSTDGITSDCTQCYVSTPNLASQLAAAHLSFSLYMEGIPSRCFLAPYGGDDYAAKHDPFRYYSDVRASPVLCDHIEPESELPATLRRGASAVARFVWVTPDLCHDGHDCPLAEAASWLSGFVAMVTASTAWRDNGILFVTWDESDGDDSTVVFPSGIRPCCGGGHIATLVIAPGVHGAVVAVDYNHYSLLATIERAFGLPLLGAAADATAMTAFFPPRARTPTTH